MLIAVTTTKKTKLISSHYYLPVGVVTVTSSYGSLANASSTTILIWNILSNTDNQSLSIIRNMINYCSIYSHTDTSEQLFTIYNLVEKLGNKEQQKPITNKCNTYRCTIKAHKKIDPKIANTGREQILNICVVWQKYSCSKYDSSLITMPATEELVSGLEALCVFVKIEFQCQTNYCYYYFYY